MKPGSQQLKNARSFFVVMVILHLVLLSTWFVRPTPDPRLFDIKMLTIIEYIQYIELALILVQGILLITNRDWMFSKATWYFGIFYVMTILNVTILLYLWGFIQLLSLFFQEYLFPRLSESTSFVLANLLGWILSGVIGNFFYDLLKKLIINKEHNRTN